MKVVWEESLSCDSSKLDRPVIDMKVKFDIYTVHMFLLQVLT